MGLNDERGVHPPMHTAFAVYHAFNGSVAIPVWARTTQPNIRAVLATPILQLLAGLLPRDTTSTHLLDDALTLRPERVAGRAQLLALLWRQ